MRRLIFGIVLVPHVAFAQTAAYGDARVQVWTLASGHLGASEMRTGLTTGVGFLHGSGRSGILVGFVPEAGVDPGWQVIAAQTGASVRFTDVEFGFRLGGGALHMSADERRRVSQRCSIEIGCFFEAESYATGWSGLGLVSGEIGVRINRRFGMAFGLGRTLLLAGANSEMSLGFLSAGVTYQW